MSIGIDPRTFSALIRLQMASPLYADNAYGTSSGNGSLFGTLLGELLAGGGTTASAPGYGYAGLYGTSLSSPYAGPLYSGYSGALGVLGALYPGTLHSSSLLPLLTRLQSAYAGTDGDASDNLYDALIRQSAERYGIDPALVKAVVRTESAFNPYAVSRAGAKGLMQLMDATARSLGVTDPFDPAQNVAGGTRYLAYLIGKYGGNVKAALAAYNAGPGRVDRLGILTDEAFDEKQSLLPEETREYVAKVLDAFERYRGAAL